MKIYEYTFENGNIYRGTAEDKAWFVSHLTKAEKAEFGKVVTKKVMTDEEIKAWETKVNSFMILA